MNARAHADRTAIVGVVENANHAVLVTVGADLTLLDRRAVALTRPGTPTHPHHHEGSWALGRYPGTSGAKRLQLGEVVALVERVRAAAERGAADALDGLAASLTTPVTRVALRACPPLPATIEERIADHRAQTYADSVMYRHALAGAAEARGLAVWFYDRERVGLRAKAVLGASVNLEALLAAMGRAAGPPWRAAHKLAATAAIAAREE